MAKAALSVCCRGHHLDVPGARGKDGGCIACARERCRIRKRRMRSAEQGARSVTFDVCQCCRKPMEASLLKSCERCRKADKSMSFEEVRRRLDCDQILECAPAWVRSATQEERDAWIADEVRRLRGYSR